ncbi:MAG: BatA domain-containing protein, partial [Myxococcales bacterium]
MRGVEFANPLLLWGALLALVPLIIHLFSRRKAKPHAFAAIEFVLRSRRRTASRLRLKRLLLFLTRTLLLLAVPLALARPQPVRDAAAAQTPQGPAATAIVLDTSLSMAYALGGKSLLERARDMARDALGRLQPEDPVTLVLCDEKAPLPAAPGFDRRRVRELIDEAPQSYGAQDLSACLNRAARALAESTLPAKRILLATDLTAAGFRLDLPPPTIQTTQGEVKPEVVLLDAAQGAGELPNAALTGLRVEPAPAVGHRAYQFTVTVANHAREPLKDATVVLRVGKEVVAKGFVDVPARGTAVKALTYRFPEGGTFTGSAELAGDALAPDDQRHFVLRVPRDVRALVVDGAPHPVRFRDEAFFVETALSAPGSPVRPTLRDADTALGEKFADYDLVLLLNVRTLPPEKAAELKAFVESGGGLFLSMGDQVDADTWNAAFGELLPRRLHLVKTAVDRQSEDADRK